jgi:hypothetical protein
MKTSDTKTAAATGALTCTSSTSPSLGAAAAAPRQKTDFANMDIYCVRRTQPLVKSIATTRHAEQACWFNIRNACAPDSPRQSPGAAACTCPTMAGWRPIGRPARRNRRQVRVNIGPAERSEGLHHDQPRAPSVYRRGWTCYDCGVGEVARTPAVRSSVELPAAPSSQAAIQLPQRCAHIADVLHPPSPRPSLTLRASLRAASGRSCDRCSSDIRKGEPGRTCKTCEFDVCSRCCDDMLRTEAHGFGDKTGIDEFIVELVGETAW